MIIEFFTSTSHLLTNNLIELQFVFSVFSDSQVRNHNYGTGYQCIVYRDAVFIHVCVTVVMCFKD